MGYRNNNKYHAIFGSFLILINRYTTRGTETKEIPYSGNTGIMENAAAVIKTKLFQQLQMLKCAFHQRLRRGMTVLFQKFLIQTAAIDANADGNLFLLANVNNRFDPVFPTNIAGIDADLGCAAFCRSDGQLVIKMNVRNQG